MCVEQKQIEALKDLCLKAGITDADIAACAPQCKFTDLYLLTETSISYILYTYAKMR